MAQLKAVILKYGWNRTILGTLATFSTASTAR